jgi:IQ calmodulin-binding motif-containing protein 1
MLTLYKYFFPTPDAPKLPEVADKDLEVFVCRSIPVATKAQLNHLEELKQRNYPWWKKLGDEFQEPGLEEADFLF